MRLLGHASTGHIVRRPISGIPVINGIAFLGDSRAASTGPIREKKFDGH